MVPTLVLFDVDGTLVDAAGAGRGGFEQAFSRVFGIQDVLASRAVATLVLGDVYGPDGEWTARDEAELLAPYAQRGIYRALLRTLKEFDFRLHSNAQLAQLPHGTLVVFGTHDAVVRPMDIDARVRFMPAGRLVMLSRIGHLPQVEAASEVGRLLLDFVQGRA